MELLINLVTMVFVVSALAVIVLVLLQHGKGADMGAAFGSGSAGSIFGSAGAANFLSRSTAVCAGIFFVCCFTLVLLTSPKAQKIDVPVVPVPANTAKQPATTAPAAAPQPAAPVKKEIPR